ncbi:ubiquitin C-terminal hydrolase Ubp14 [Aspergillus melleus]|uniref:Ubiquitin C-terminal hydrolase Ubp14 n=1 Tax=Aspergillus melleus TaxID=138277 RepID=A0ACC3BC27_9EURO|nr:ubiquitin C-terminal hydrolase Ubp14 [Aspergillus melleus]
MTSHAVAVKLGSITADGTADIYCYACNEERIDPDLGPHLAHWGINLMAREKTEKSLMEMQIEHNLKWDFSMTTEDGHELTPVFGPGLTGLANLGNSCYLSSVLQCIFDLPEFQNRYYHEHDEPPFTPLPAEDLETQMRKVADGILSGRYSQADKNTVAAPDSSEKPQQKGLAPTMFKHLVGRGHEEFSTMRQQDAFEFLLHIFKIINLAKHSGNGENPIKAFDFAMEQRLQCLSCQKVRYKVDGQDNVSIPVPARRLTSDDSSSADSFAPVTLYDCLDAFTSEEIVQMDCPSCKAKDGFSKRSSFRTLPQHLVVNARRFEIVNWVPTKLEIPVEVSDQEMDLSQYLSGGQRANEELLPDINTAASFTPNEIALDQLLSMGFPKARCEKALYVTGNTDAEAAMNWLFAHMDDDDVDEPLGGNKSLSSSDASYDAGKVAQLGEMGIEEPRAKKALEATGGDVVRAIDWVFSHPDALIEDENQASDDASSGQPRVPGFDSTPARYQLRSIICHKGSSIHAG